ncbi:MAG: DUF2070 family protein [Candidatus Micrarchaeota archaeon]|nr:DUF2070 family protein [Candidatus Micrarchaeota archaeon]
MSSHGKTARQSKVSSDISKAVKLTNLFIKLPSVGLQLFVLFAFSLIFATILSYIEGTNVFQAFFTSFLIISVPAALSALLFRILRGVLLKRSFFLMLIASLLYMAIYILYFMTHSINFLVLGFSAIALIVFLSSYYILGLRYSAVALSIIQLFFFSVMLYYAEYITAAPKDLFLKLVVTSVIFSAFTYVLIYFINAPIKKAFSVSGTKALSMFVSQWLYESKDLDAEFDRIGVYTDTNVDALLVKNASGTCLITSPQVHFGPFGNLGGSDFPALISKDVEKYVDCSIVMHGACTHDYNPATTEQLANITGPLASFIHTSKPQLRPAKFSFVRTKCYDATASHLILGDAVLSSFSRHPYTTEDMDYGLGLLLREIGTKDFKAVLIADEHNAETGEITQFLLGSPEASEYIGAMRALHTAAKDVKAESAKFAFVKFNRPEYKEHGISGNGISMFCFISKSNSVVYVVFDSNGVTVDMKSRIESLLRNYFDNVVIMSTDTHFLNKVSGVINPMGAASGGAESLIEKDLTENAKRLLAEASPFTCAAATIPVRVKVFGPQQSLKLIGTVNAIVSVAKVALPLILVLGTLLALWALSLI